MGQAPAEVASEPSARLVALGGTRWLDGPLPLGSPVLRGHGVPRWALTWIFPSSPVLSILLATLTVFPQMSY